MNTPILVTGGTGTLGSSVVPRLRAADREVRVLSRHPHPAQPGVEYAVGDLTTGAGLAAALAGCEVVVHLAGDARHDKVTTATLVRACGAAGVTHLVYISVTAADRIPIGYYRGKAAGERLVADSGLGWSTLRAAQFHDLVATVLGAVSRSPVLPVPSAIRLQPVDTAEVADRLVTLALGPPRGMAPSLAGPEVLSAAELTRTYLAAKGRRRRQVPLPIPGRIGRVYRNGENLELDAQTGGRTWAEFLARPTG